MPIGPGSNRVRTTRTIHSNTVLGGHKFKAALTTALTGTNNDLTIEADAPGTGGNAITVALVVAGASTPLSVSVAANAITVNVATDGGSAATSTAAQVRDAINAHAAASALVTAADATGNDGTGVVTALTATALTGGTDYVIGQGSDSLRRVQR